MSNLINYSKPKIFQQDIQNVVKILKSGYLTQGKFINLFEKKISAFVGSKYSLAVSNASAALHLACAAMKINKNDIVWCSSITFISSISCAMQFKSKIDLVEISDKDFNVDVSILEKKLINAKRTKKLPKLIILTHLGGNPCNLKEIYKLKKKFKFKIIEDASHALGSKYEGHYIGNCKFSDLTVFSFHPVKTITTLEGGIITTNKYNIYKEIDILRTLGIDRVSSKSNKNFKHHWYYEVKKLGYNFRLPEIQASLGISQLKNLKRIVKKRNFIAQYYKKKLKNSNFFSFQNIKKDNLSSYHLFIIKTKKNISINQKIKFYKLMLKNKIKLQLHYVPLYKHPLIKNYIKKKFKNFTNSEKYFKNCFSIPLYYDLSIKKQNNILAKLDKCIKLVV
jgi:dTDP-4-amino-4,6-dideoxygalactose transaminase